jgi:hypothetical protein
MTSHVTNKIFVYDIHLVQCEAVFGKHQQQLLPFECLLSTALSPQDLPTGHGSFLNITSYQPISSQSSFNEQASQQGYLPIDCVKLKLSTA